MSAHAIFGGRSKGSVFKLEWAFTLADAFVTVHRDKLWLVLYGKQ